MPINPSFLSSTVGLKLKTTVKAGVVTLQHPPSHTPKDHGDYHLLPTALLALLLHTLTAQRAASDLLGAAVALLRRVTLLSNLTHLGDRIFLLLLAGGLPVAAAGQVADALLLEGG